MPNYFYFDQNGQKQGPVNDQQLQALAARGAITPSTRLETEGGHTGQAGQIPGLKFPGQTASHTAMPNESPLLVAQVRYKSDTEATPIFPLLYDSSFRELKPETIFLWITKIIYATLALTIIIGSLVYCGFMIYTALRFIASSNGLSLLSLLSLPFICIGGFLALCLVRLSCEWGIIAIHCTLVWIVELAKLPQALRIYLEEKSKR